MKQLNSLLLNHTERFPAWMTRFALQATLVTICLAAWSATSPSNAQSSGDEGDEGPASVQEVYHDWTVICRQRETKDAKSSSTCQMNQELRDKQSGQLILSLVVPAAPLPDGANAVLIAPFGLNLSEGVTLSLLEPKPAGVEESAADIAKRARDPKTHADFRTCLPAGCLVNFVLDNSMKKSLRGGDRALVTMMSADQNKAINVALSLRGFTAAERRLNALSKQFE